MDHRIFPWELVFLLTWLTAPAQVVMVVVLSSLLFIRGGFARIFRLRSVLVLVAAYTFALALTVPLWVLLPLSLLPASTLPDTWPSLPPLAFAPAWISCFVVWVWLRGSFCASGWVRRRLTRRWSQQRGLVTGDSNCCSGSAA